MRFANEQEAAASVLAKIDSSGGPTACWHWTGARTGAGYGAIRRNGNGPDACGGCHGRMGRPDPLHFDVHHAADDAALAAVLAEFPEAAS